MKENLLAAALFVAVFIIVIVIVYAIIFVITMLIVGLIGFIIPIAHYWRVTAVIAAVILLLKLIFT